MATNNLILFLSAVYFISETSIQTGACVSPPPPPAIVFKTAKSIPGRRYPWIAIRREFLKNSTLHKVVKTFKHAARAEKWMQLKMTERPSFIGSFIPPFKNGEMIETCPTSYSTITLQPRVWFENDWCWLLKPWWGIKWTYAKCKTKECQGINPQREIPITPRYYCRPERYIVHRFVLFCRRQTQRIQIRHLRLPQCCDCFKWRCFVKGK